MNTDPNRPRGGFASKIRFAPDPKPQTQAEAPDEKYDAVREQQNSLEQRLAALEEKLNGRGSRGGFASKIRFLGSPR